MGTRGLFKTIIVSVLSIFCAFIPVILVMEGERRTGLVFVLLFTSGLLLSVLPVFCVCYTYFSKKLFRVSPETEDEIDGIINDVQQVKNNIYNNPYKN